MKFLWGSLLPWTSLMTGWTWTLQWWNEEAGVHAWEAPATGDASWGAEPAAESLGGAFYSCDDDASWAVRSAQLSTLLGDKQHQYNVFMDGCRQAATARGDSPQWRCDQEENYRMHMNTFQPPSMINYTHTGFQKTRTPTAVWDLLTAFWEKNRDSAIDEWEYPKPYHNNWDVMTTVLRIDNQSLPMGGPDLYAAIANAARQKMEEWTGMRQSSTSVYGIRIYHNQSILAPHVDRLPLVTSAIVNVAQEVDEDWYLEVYDHMGMAHNVTMKPGDMVLYESHSVIHGRPFPLNGKFYANVFIHFEPLGPLNISEAPTFTPAPLQPGQSESDLPPYIMPGSSWEPEWRRDWPQGWPLLNEIPATVQKGDLETIKYVAARYPSRMLEADLAGWQPLHEACRSGFLDIVKFLVEDMHADINAVTLVTTDPTCLSIAQHNLPADHEVIQYLRSHGAVERVEDLPPEHVQTYLSQGHQRREELLDQGFTEGPYDDNDDDDHHHPEDMEDGEQDVEFENDEL